jgi:hypothetical protein
MLFYIKDYNTEAIISNTHISGALRHQASAGIFAVLRTGFGLFDTLSNMQYKYEVRRGNYSTSIHMRGMVMARTHITHASFIVCI